MVDTACEDACLPDQPEDGLQMTLTFYRGLRCPICRPHVRDLNRKLDEFEKRGGVVVAISTDTRGPAQQSRKDWGIERLAIVYRLSIEQPDAGDCTSRRPSARTHRPFFRAGTVPDPT